MEIIVYGSQYGTTEEYAMELSKKTGIKAEKYSDIKDINRLLQRLFSYWPHLKSCSMSSSCPIRFRHIMLQDK